MPTRVQILHQHNDPKSSKLKYFFGLHRDLRIHGDYGEASTAWTGRSVLSLLVVDTLRKAAYLVGYVGYCGTEIFRSKSTEKQRQR